MRSNIVGIDIGSSSLRAMELKRTSGKPVVMRYHEVPLPEGSVRRGEVLDAPGVTAAIKSLWATGGFSVKNVVIGLGGPRVMARELSVPRASLARIRESLPSLVAGSLPIPPERALIDFYPVSESVGTTGPMINGLMVAAIKEVVEVNVDAVMRAGLRPILVDLIPFALARAISPIGVSVGLEAIVSVGANTTNIVITQDGVPHFVRIISSGGDDVTRAIMSACGLKRTEAELAKRELGLLVSATRPDVVAVIRRSTNTLLHSIQDTLNYFVGLRAGTVLERIIITGGGRHLPGMSPALADATGRSVVEADLESKVTLGRGVSSIVDPGRRGIMTTAFGLALGAFE